MTVVIVVGVLKAEVAVVEVVAIALVIVVVAVTDAEVIEAVPLVIVEKDVLVVAVGVNVGFQLPTLLSCALQFFQIVKV